MHNDCSQFKKQIPKRKVRCFEHNFTYLKVSLRSILFYFIGTCARIIIYLDSIFEPEINDISFFIFLFIICAIVIKLNWNNSTLFPSKKDNFYDFILRIITFIYCLILYLSDIPNSKKI